MAKGVVIPLYHPSSWLQDSIIPHFQTIQRLAQTYPNVPIVVALNRTNGPSANPDDSYLTWIPILQSLGVKFVGYIDATLNSVTYDAATNTFTQQAGLYVPTIAECKVLVDKWFQNYPTLNGIMIDDYAQTYGGQRKTVAQYNDLNAFIRSKVTNGTPIIYANIDDLTGTVNGTYDQQYYLDSQAPDIFNTWEIDPGANGTWVPNYEIADRAGVTIQRRGYLGIGVASSDVTDAQLTTLSEHFGWVYFSHLHDGEGTWFVVSNWVDRQMAFLANLNSSATTAAPTSTTTPAPGPTTTTTTTPAPTTTQPPASTTTSTTAAPTTTPAPLATPSITSYGSAAGTISPFWSTVSGASYYNLYWTNDGSTPDPASGFTHAVTDIYSNYYTLSNLAGGTYKISVRAVGASGQLSSLSTPITVTIAGATTTTTTTTTTTPAPTPAPVFVGASASFATANISWTVVSAVSYYELYWTSDGSTPTLTSAVISGINGTSYSHTNLPTGLYSYRVRAIGVNGVASGFQGVAQVSVDGLTTTTTTAAPNNKPAATVVMTLLTGTTTPAPTTPAPTTPAPTTLAPTTLAPTTLAPTTAAPTTAAPAPTVLEIETPFGILGFAESPGGELEVVAIGGAVVELSLGPDYDTAVVQVSTPYGVRALLGLRGGGNA